MSRNTELSSMKSDIGQTNCNDIIPTFETVVGFNEVKKFINERLKYFYEEKELNEEIGYKPSRGLVLYGAPGIGKTMFLNAIMNEYKDNSNFVFDITSARNIRSSLVGGSEKKIHKMFDELRRKDKDTVLFMDEFSSLFPKNTSGAMALERIDAFLSEFDGIYEKGSREKIFIIATTNKIRGINEAVIRSGRFDSSFEIKKPNRKQRLKLFEMYVCSLKNIKTNKRFISNEIYDKRHYISNICKGMTGADFSLLRSKLMNIYKEKRRTSENNRVRIELVDLMSCLNDHHFRKIISNN